MRRRIWAVGTLETVPESSPMSQHTLLNRLYDFPSLAKSQPGNYNRASAGDSAVTMATHAEGKWWRTCHTRKQSSYVPLQYLVGLCGICGTFCALAQYELVLRIPFHTSIKSAEVSKINLCECHYHYWTCSRKSIRKILCKSKLCLKGNFIKNTNLTNLEISGETIAHTRGCWARLNNNIQQAVWCIEVNTTLWTFQKIWALHYQFGWVSQLVSSLAGSVISLVGAGCVCSDRQDESVLLSRFALFRLFVLAVSLGLLGMFLSVGSSRTIGMCEPFLSAGLNQFGRGGWDGYVESVGSIHLVLFIPFGRLFWVDSWPVWLGGFG
jgi:hypothetical protein